MSLSLPDHVTLPTSPGRHNLAIAEISAYGVIWLFQIAIRSGQEWRYWSSKRKSRHPVRCILRGFFNLIGVVAQSMTTSSRVFTAPNLTRCSSHRRQCIVPVDRKSQQEYGNRNCHSAGCWVCPFDNSAQLSRSTVVSSNPSKLGVAFD
jgi:hypothetical protein